MERDGHVRLLPVHVANKIAAGEVVERPASVLKELLENSIDAGATRIEVTVTAGGRKLVSVRDNGCGMERADALMAFESHATSKIRDVDDIERIDTLGFRGEAIPSIASVSRFTMTTRRAQDESGTRVVVNAGVLAETGDCGAPAGTCMEVRDLFCNVPARQKFLRGFATEEGHLRNVFTITALAHPDVGFTLMLDGRETYRLAPGATLEERMRELFGAEFAESMLKVALPPPMTGRPPYEVQVHGYIERPSSGMTLRRDQYIFVNGRPATSPEIVYALREACPRARDEARPALVLFLDLPPNQVDVNVHPAKRDVRFRNSRAVKEAVIAAVTNALSPITPTEAPSAPDFATPFTTAPVQGRFSLPQQNDFPPNPSLPPSPNSPLPPSPNSNIQTFQHSNIPSDPSSPIPPPSHPSSPIPHPSNSNIPPAPPAPSHCRWFKYLAQTSVGYVLFETEAGLVVMDPVAARERIAFDRLLGGSGQVASQTLLLPEVVKLSPTDSARIRSFLPELAATGFSVEEFGKDTWKVDAVPALVSGVPVGSLLASVATDIAEAGSRKGAERWREEVLARSLAKSFAGVASKLTEDAAVQLVKELLSCAMAYTSPRGRPTMTPLTNRDIDRRLGKT